MCAPGAMPRKPPGTAAVSGHDAGDVGAVAVEVAARPAGAVDEVHVHRDAAAQRARFGEPRIDHRDADAPPGVAPDLFEAGPHLLRAGGFRRHGHRGIDRPIGGQSANRRIGRERRHRGLVHADDGPRSQPALDLEPVPLNQRLHRIRRAGQDQLGALPARHPVGDIGGDARAEPARAVRDGHAHHRPQQPHGHHQRDAGGGAAFLPRKGEASKSVQGECDAHHSKPSQSFGAKSAEEHSAYGRASEQDLCQIAEIATWHWVWVRRR